MSPWFDWRYDEEEAAAEAELYEQFRALMIDDPQQSSEKLITACSIPDDQKFDFAKLSDDLQLDVLDHLDAKTRLKLLQVDKTLRQNVLDWGPFGKRIPRIFFSCAFPDEANKDPYFEIDNLAIEHDWWADHNMAAIRRLFNKICTVKLLDLTLEENVKEDPRYRFLEHLLPALRSVQELVICVFEFTDLAGFMSHLERLRVDGYFEISFDEDCMNEKTLERIVMVNGSVVIELDVFEDCPNINLYTVFRKANTSAQFIEIVYRSRTSIMCSQLLDSLLLHGVPSLFEGACISFPIRGDIYELLGKFVRCDKMFFVHEDEEMELVVTAMIESNPRKRNHIGRLARRVICYRQSVNESIERYFLIESGCGIDQIFCKEIRCDT